MASDATLLPCGSTTASSAYTGYIRTASGEVYALRVRLDSTSEFEACPRLRAKLAGQEESLAQRLKRNSGNVQGFLADLNDLLERQEQVGTSATTSRLPLVAFYERLISELDAIGWSTLESVSPALDSLQLRVEDAAGRCHVLGLALAPDYPRTPPRATVALPEPFELRWTSDGTPSLATALAQFRAALARHQLLWDQLDDLDAHTWVLEPKQPTRDGVTRRVALGDHCSLQIDLQVANPASLPELQFLGADRVLAPLRHSLNARLSRWQLERSVRTNLEDILQRDFPTPDAAVASAGGEDQYAVECAICYSYDLDGAVPECACDGCSKPFHKSCLGEWLRAIPTTQQAFNRLHGECPYCSRAITCDA